MLTLVQRIAGRARWELREWRQPSRPSFVQEELDAALLEGIAWQAGERVLDVGCARGHYLEQLRRRGAIVTGIDISTDCLRIARGRRFDVAAASGSALPFADGAFDAVVCHKTMHLFADVDRVMAEFRRIVRPGGRIVFSSSDTRSPYARCQAAVIRMTGNSNWGFMNRLSAGDWVTRFERQGCRLAGIHSCNLVWPLVFRVCDRWLIPNEWMRRYARWVRRRTGAPMRGPRPHRLAQDFVVEMIRP